MSLTNNFDKLKKEKAGETQTQNYASEEIETHASAGNVRNLCFVQPNGESLFLNYAYLISGAYSPKDNIITLIYTTHAVTLKGQNLEPLLDQLMQQKPKKIICLDERYAGTKEKNETVITEITISEKG